MNNVKLHVLLLLSIVSMNVFASEASLKIYAASSLSNVLPEIVKAYQKKSKIIFNFDASSKLAMQIASGAPADIYFSADTEWMDHLQKEGKIISESKIDLLTNKIVLIIPQDSNKTPRSAKELSDPFYHHIALAAESVPAGKFARSALNSEGVLTESFKKKIVNADNVRIALSWVAEHEAAAGIVYATDAQVEKRVKVAFEFKENSHPKIIYPVAIISKSLMIPKAQDFLNFCKTDKAKEIFKKAGFINL